MPIATSWDRMFSVARWRPGLPPGNSQPVSREVIKLGRHLDWDRAEGDVHSRVSGDGDLARSHRHNARKRLSEKQSEQTADARVAAQGRVVEQTVDGRPALRIGHRHCRWRARDVR